MKAGTWWYEDCPACGHSGERVCQKARPSYSPGACGWCLSKTQAWVQVEVEPLGYMRLSGFSTSDSDFTPHWNSAFGKRVGSLAEMKALQAQHGACDSVVKGDGADRHAPRDLQRRLVHHRDIADKMARGAPIDAGNGVSIKYVDPDSGD